MRGQMMRQELTIGSLIDHAARYHGATPITSVETSGAKERTDWGTVARRARQLASALGKLGLQPGTRCATIAWNNQRHLQIYFGVSGSGLICHTVNPRLFPDQIVYVLTHAEDRLVFVDTTFLPILVALRDKLSTVEQVVLMGPRDEEALAQFPGLIFYDELITEGDADYSWPDLDEDTASSLCYTSGTTGNPKGVLYSHRSTVLHSFAAISADMFGFSARDVILPVVPMFHVNAWGVPYAAAMSGSQLVLPGPGLDGDALVRLIDSEAVTLAFGVPTIWRGLLQSAERLGTQLSSLKRTVVGGAACPASMIEEFRERYDVEVMHAWGMTETSPLGTANSPLARHAELPEEERRATRYTQGRPPFGVELKIVDDAGGTLPEDGAHEGHLLMRGHWVLDAYFRTDEAILQDGWFPTGDVARIDAEGYMDLRDRSKDVIKSGGEWISSVELENIALGHPDLADAAVIGAAHAKWDERPVLVAVAAAGKTPRPEDVLTIYQGRVAKWQIPDAVVFTDELPRNATGKVRKNLLRAQFGDVLNQD